MSRPTHTFDLVQRAAASARGDQPAFVFPETTLTWAEMERDVRMVAGTLMKLGVKQGDSVAVLLPNLPLHPILAFAAPLIGAAYLPINPAQSEDQLARLLRKPVPAAAFVLESQIEALSAELERQDLHIPLFPVGENGFILGESWPRDADPYGEEPIGELDSIAVRRHTSGVSQECQLVPLTHGNLLSATEAARKMLQVLPTSVLYGTHAFHNSFGFLFQMLLPAWAGCTLHTCRHWSAPEVARLLRDHEITGYIGEAPHFAQLQPELEALAAQEAEEEPAKQRSETAESTLTEQEEEPPAAGEPAGKSADETVQEGEQAADSSEHTGTAGGDVNAPEDRESPGNEPVEDPQLTRARDIEHSVRTHSPLRKLRFALSAGAHSDLYVLTRFADSLGCPVATAYGATETAGIIAINPAHFDPSSPSASGRIISGLDVSIRNDDGSTAPLHKPGEIWVRGPNVFQGYENDEIVPVEEGWFKTSDLGYVDEDHWLYVISRKEDRIIRGGFPIYPLEVEAVLNLHPGVHESAVVGRPHSGLGQEVVAFIVPAGQMMPDESSLREFCSDKLPAYKIPTLFKQLDQLPRSGNGFILRRDLRGRLHQG